MLFRSQTHSNCNFSSALSSPYSFPLILTIPDKPFFALLSRHLYVLQAYIPHQFRRPHFLLSSAVVSYIIPDLFFFHSLLLYVVFPLLLFLIFYLVKQGASTHPEHINMECPKGIFLQNFSYTFITLIIRSAYGEKKSQTDDTF